MKQKIERPIWTDYFMEMAVLASTRATCLRRKVGAVLVKDNQILSTGYNGAPVGFNHCYIEGCMRLQLGVPSGEKHELCRAVHAEQNAIIQAAVNGVSIKGATLYCTTFPCSICAKMLINAKIEWVYYKEGYPDKMTEQLFEESEIIVVKI